MHYHSHPNRNERKPGLFWMAKRPGFAPLHFFGALHFGTEAMYPLPEILIDAYCKADAIAFETNLAELATPSFNAMMSHMGRQPEGTTLEQCLQPDTWGKLVAVANTLGYSSDSVNDMKSWYAASVLTSAALRKAGLNSYLGIDGFVFQQAHADAKKIICLETPRQQLELLAEINTATDEAFMQHTIEELNDMVKFSHQMLDLWLAGDAKGLAKLVADGFKDNNKLRKRMLEDRNQHWFDELHHANESGLSVLAVVGTGHLVGDNSLLNLFNDNGYQITNPH